MLSMIFIKCSACDSTYKFSSEETNVVVLFHCVECGEYSVYVSGNVLPLDRDIMCQGTQAKKLKIRHIVETLQLWACDYASNVLRNVDRVIDVDVGINIRNADVGADCSDFAPLPEEDEENDAVPSSKLNQNLPREENQGITDEEVHDFIRIDLNLIDKESYFNRFFGEGSR